MVKALPMTLPELRSPPLKEERTVVDAPRPVTVARVSASVAVRVSDPPKESDPPPVKIPDELMVTLELARLALVIPAVPDKLALVRPEMVLLPAAMVLLVKVSVVALPTYVSVPWKVKVPVVPANVKPL